MSVVQIYSVEIKNRTKRRKMNLKHYLLQGVLHVFSANLNRLSDTLQGFEKNIKNINNVLTLNRKIKQQVRELKFQFFFANKYPLLFLFCKRVRYIERLKSSEQSANRRTSLVHRSRNCDTYGHFCLSFGDIAIFINSSKLISKIIVAKINSCVNVVL